MQWQIQDFKEEGVNLLISIIFVKNCIKMKSIAVRGDAHPSCRPRPATALVDPMKVKGNTPIVQ